MTDQTKLPLVLFLCTGNSARSQMAEAILRAKVGDRFRVASAGLDPKGVHPNTITVLREIGLATEGLRSKSSSEFLGQTLVYAAIVVCAHAQAACPRVFPFAHASLYWPFDDPAAFVGSQDQQLAKFREVRDSIKATIVRWLDEGARVE